MNALVTGAAGFIGSHLVERLLHDGGRVVGVDNFSLGRRENLREVLGNSRFTLIEADLADASSVELLAAAARERGVDCVWHLAANSDIAAGAETNTLDLRNTFLTTIHALDLARTAGIRQFAFTSSSAIYGDLGLGENRALREDDGPLMPVSNYGAMKLASEGAISAACSSFLDKAVIVRLPNVVGPRMTHGLLHDIFAKLRLKPDRLQLLGDGRQCKQYMHVGETIDAALFIWTRSREECACYNVGTDDEGISVAEIAKRALQAAGVELDVEYAGGSRGWVGDVPRFRYCVEKLTELGWKTQLSSSEAIARACADLVRGEGRA